MGCCSDHAITFHYVSPSQMYVMDYLIYHLHPFGTNMKFLDAQGHVITDFKQLDRDKIFDYVQKLAARDLGAEDALQLQDFLNRTNTRKK